MDLEQLRVSAPQVLRRETDVVPPRTHRRQVHPFVRGPIPLWWLARASEAGSAAIRVGLCLWFMRGVLKSGDAIKVSQAVLRKLKLSRDQSQRGLKALAAAGLVEFIVAGRGHCPIVKLLNAGIELEPGSEKSSAGTSEGIGPDTPGGSFP